MSLPLEGRTEDVHRFDKSGMQGFRLMIHRRHSKLSPRTCVDRLRSLWLRQDVHISSPRWCNSLSAALRRPLTSTHDQPGSASTLECPVHLTACLRAIALACAHMHFRSAPRVGTEPPEIANLEISGLSANCHRVNTTRVIACHAACRNRQAGRAVCHGTLTIIKAWPEHLQRSIAANLTRGCQRARNAAAGFGHAVASGRKCAAMPSVTLAISTPSNPSGYFFLR